MGTANSKLTLFGLVVASGLVASCSWDNSPPPYHSVISYDPSRAQTYVSTVSGSNTPSTGDWETNQISGVGYGSGGAYSGTPAAHAVGGAVSTPSGVSSGGATGTSPASGIPGTIIANSPGGIIGATPSPSTPTLPGPITSPQPATTIGPSSTLFTPSTSPTSPQYPAISTPTGIGSTNTGSALLFTNTYRGPTNSLTSPGFNPAFNPGLNVPRP